MKNKFSLRDAFKVISEQWQLKISDFVNFYIVEHFFKEKCKIFVLCTQNADLTVSRISIVHIIITTDVKKFWNM